MVLTSLQEQTLINWLNHIDINQPVQMESVNDLFRTFEGNIDPGGPMGIKLYSQATKKIYKETDKLDISVSNAKDIIDHFLGISNKYGYGFLAFMVGTAAGANNIIRVV